MRIVIDMQGAQSESRFRGIGRYTLSFVEALIHNKGHHEIILVLNGMLPTPIDELRARFGPLLPSTDIVTWHAPGGVAYRDGDPVQRQRAARLREDFLESLAPDLVHVTSLFEGYLDDAVTGFGRLTERCATSSMVYDLIPLLNPKQYLDTNAAFSRFYHDKLSDLSHASCLLAISEFARDEVLTHTNISPNFIHTISTAVDPRFQPLEMSETEKRDLLQSHGVDRPFFFYTGGSDERKNLPRLIEAYAGLALSMRKQFQLVLAGHMAPTHVAELTKIGKKFGLGSDELVFTGYLSDDELIKFYNCAFLFVFPSWHEGFGLPALEAMSCGTPVIGAHNTSLPEVIGDPRCLFDPFQAAQLKSQLVTFVENENLRHEVIANGLQRAQQFSWNQTAQRALAAWGRGEPRRSEPLNVSTRREHLLADLVSMLDADDANTRAILSTCLAQNQIAGRDRQLLIDVSEISQRDAATGVQRVVRSYLKCMLENPPACFSIELVYASGSEGYRYARHFLRKLRGEPLREDEIEQPINWTRGDIFFALDMQHDVQLRHASFLDQLYHDGVNVVFLVHDLLPVQYPDLFELPHLSQLHRDWLTMIASKTAAICVSQATANAFRRWLVEQKVKTSADFMIDWVHNGGDLDASMPSRGLPDDAEATLSIFTERPTFLCVGTLEPRKAQEQILKAVELLWADKIDCNVVFVGHSGWKYEAFVSDLLQHPEFGQRLFWLKGISDEFLDRVYDASTCLVAASLDEGFGLPIVEAAKHNLPIIARDIPVFREIAGDEADYFIGGDGEDLAAVMRAWMKKNAHVSHYVSRIPWAKWQDSAELLIQKLTTENYVRRQLLVDISELVRVDAKTGIQRVVRSILKEWLISPPKGFRVEAVYADADGTYRYARTFLRSWQINVGPSQDDPIEYGPGDVFYGLDYQPVLQAQQRAFYKYLRQQGVLTYFLIYDLLPVEMPEYFPDGYDVVFSRWLEVVAEGTGAACISGATAAALKRWVQREGKSLSKHFDLGVCYIGADIENSEPSRGLPPDAEQLLKTFEQRKTFLLVGTVEPRKGHAQTLKAFDSLWQSGHDINLVIVGKRGWMIDALVTDIENHPSFNKKLFWLQNVSDEFLEKIYGVSTCVLVPSRGEGFGLPLIEAAHRRIPVIARNLDVFREIGGNYPTYFDGESAEALAEIVAQWLQSGTDQQQDHYGVKALTWKESAFSMAQFLTASDKV